MHRLGHVSAKPTRLHGTWPPLCSLAWASAGKPQTHQKVTLCNHTPRRGGGTWRTGSKNKLRAWQAYPPQFCKVIATQQSGTRGSPKRRLVSHEFLSLPGRLQRRLGHIHAVEERHEAEEGSLSYEEGLNFMHCICILMFISKLFATCSFHLLGLIGEDS